MIDFTTIEKLQMEVSRSGAVLKYGDKVFVTYENYKGEFYAEIYELVETPEETGLDSIECRAAFIEKSLESFEDNGHAIAWCFGR